MKFIVAVDKNWNIGKGNDLLFRLPSDMKHFKEYTTGKTVIMGDRTLLSLPGSKPLKDRNNIVLSLDKEFNPEGTTICHSLSELAEILLKMESTENVYVIGGATIYRLLEPFCDEAIITKVDALRDDADVSITNLDELDNWKVVKEDEPFEDNGLNIKFVDYENNAPKAFEEMKLI